MNKIEIRQTEYEGPNEAVEAFVASAEGLPFFELAFFYVKSVVLPPILADRLRRRGVSGVGPRDFECGCMTDVETDRLLCLGFRESCAESAVLNKAPVSIPEFHRRSPQVQMMLEYSVRVCATYVAADAKGRRDILLTLQKAKARHQRRFPSLQELIRRVTNADKSDDRKTR